MSSDSEYDENAASDQQSEGEENGSEENDGADETTTEANDQTNGNSIESSSATWNDLVGSALTFVLMRIKKTILISNINSLAGFG